MMRLAFLLCCLLILASCAPLEGDTANSTLTSPSAPSPTSTMVYIHPTSTNKPTMTATTTPTHFPTFDASNAVMFTPPAPALCPPDKPEFELSPAISWKTVDATGIIYIVKDALQSGASFSQVATAFGKAFKTNDIVRLVDVTGDQVPELIVTQLGHVFVIECDHKSYKTILDYPGGDISLDPSIISIEDMNLNGIPDIVFAFYFSSGSNTAVDIYEWDGNQFVQLVQANLGEDSPSTSRIARALNWYAEDWLSSEPGNTLAMEGGADIEIQDIDNNGTKELILTDYGPSHLDTMLNFGPWRGKQVIFSWDGVHYRYSSLEMQPANYRFQVVQDADRQFLLGNYEAARELYYAVISESTLDWWSPEKMRYLAATYNASQYGGPTPEVTMPIEDKSEYLRLSGYARYRLVLQYLTLGQVDDAKRWYDNLVSSPSAAGDEWAQIAALLWNNYQKSRTLESSCKFVVEFVASHPEVLKPLGHLDHGFQSHIYEPNDVCPATFSFAN